MWGLWLLGWGVRGGDWWGGVKGVGWIKGGVVRGGMWNSIQTWQFLDQLPERACIYPGLERPCYLF